MNKFSSMLVMAGMVISSLTSCNENEFVNDSSEGMVDMGFAVKVNGQRSRMAADLNTLSAEKFMILAYQKVGNDQYKFAKATASDANQYDALSQMLSNADFILPVGEYKFLSLYNVNEGNVKFEYYGLNSGDTENKTWNEILSSAKMTRTDFALDVNEIFSYSSSADVCLNDAKGKFIVPMELFRVNSRIDVLIKKMYNDQEVSYKDRDVMGVAANIKQITTSTEGCAATWNLAAASTTTTGQAYQYVDTQLSNIIVGTKDSASDDVVTPPATGEQHKINNLSAANFMKGTCYYKGAYILPFVSADQDSPEMSVDVTFEQKATDAVRIINVPKVKAKKNYVSLITMNLITLKQPDPEGNGDDNEDIFNPNVQCKVTINTVWAGVENTEVDI